MSSLIALQSKDMIVLASDTAISANNGEKFVRVGNESKLHKFEGFTVFISGRLKLKDLLLSKLNYESTVDELEEALIKYIKPLSTEFSLELVIAMHDLNELIFMSSVDGFNRSNSKYEGDIKIFTSGHLTREICDEFIYNYNYYPVFESLVNTYRKFSRNEIGGELEVVVLGKDAQTTTFNIDNIKCLSDKEAYLELNLVHARKLVGDIILGNNLVLTSVSGVLEADGDTITIKDNLGNVKVELGKYTDGANTQYGLKVSGGAITIRTSDNPNEGTVIDHNGITVYDSSGNVVFDTVNGADFSGNVIGDAVIDVNGDITLGGRLTFNEMNGGTEVCSITNFSGALNFHADTHFYFHETVYVDADIYMNGKKVLTEP